RNPPLTPLALGADETRPTRVNGSCRSSGPPWRRGTRPRDRARLPDALRRAARTWAPYSLPLDRAEALSAAPPLGQGGIYEHWANVPYASAAVAGSLAVVSIGTAVDARDASPDEIAGALAVQIERLVIDRYQREHPKKVAAMAATIPSQATTEQN